jgi:hypothetical protein
VNAFLPRLPAARFLRRSIENYAICERHVGSGTRKVFYFIKDGSAPTTSHYSVIIPQMFRKCAGDGKRDLAEFPSSTTPWIEASRGSPLGWNSFVSLRKVENSMIDQNPLPEVIVPGDEDRIADFFARHGGRGLVHERAGDKELHTRGWSEVYAADGHKLRSEWSKAGSRIQTNFTEIPP